MSNYNSEWGTIQFTKTGYMQVIRAIRAAFNDHYTHAYATSERAYALLSGITGRGVSQLQKNRFDSWKEGRGDQSLRLNVNGSPLRSDPSMIALIERELFRGKGGALTKPRKSAFPKLINTQTSFAISLLDGAASLRFAMNPKDGTGTCTWNVNEGNRGVEQAHESVFYGIFCRVLNHYKWRRNEGGEWLYTDEFSRDSAHEHGSSAESVSRSWGPLGENAARSRLEDISCQISRRRGSQRSPFGMGS